MSNVEIFDLFASLSTLASVILLWHKSPIGWIVGFVSCCFYMGEFMMLGHTFNLLLQLVFMAQQLVGLLMWNRTVTKPVKHIHIGYILATMGVLLFIWRFHSLDAATTIGSLIATMLLILMFAEAWLLWAAIDVMYLVLFYNVEMYCSLFVYLILFLVSILAYRKWELQL